MKISGKRDYYNSTESKWNSVSIYSLIIYCFFSLLVLIAAHTGDRWVPILDSANLAFHEAGHPIFGMLSGALMVYGGTIAQLVFPVIAAISFRERHQTLSFSLALLWLAENLFNIARYMADARSQILPIVGNREHDWTEIFLRWNVLQSDTLIAGTVRTFGWLLIISVGIWLWYRYQDK